MNTLRFFVCCGIILSISLVESPAQGFLNKMKKKLERAGEDIIDETVDDALDLDGPSNSGSRQPGRTPTSAPSNSGGNRNSSGRPTNNAGGGLVMTPPDVRSNISDAESSFSSGQYSDARYAIQQALLGVELELGHQILESLPQSVQGIPAHTENDQVSSTGIGFVGLNIQREYYNNDQSVDIAIANNSAWMSAVNMYMTNPSYVSSDENRKVTKVQGYRALIEYNDRTGYKVSMPMGQTSLIIWELVNFRSESEVMSALDQFNVEEIKSILGEK